MVITHMEVVRKMLKIKYKIFFSIILFSFLSFNHSILAVNYGAGSYGDTLYSSTIPGVTAIPAEGIYNKVQQVTLLTQAGNTIRYLFTATPLNCSSGNLYVDPISIIKSTRIYTLTCDIHGNSTPNSFNYTIKTESTSSGSTVQNRINNLISIGKTKEAQELAKQYNIKMETTTNSKTILTKNLKLGMIDNEVKLLQIFLNKKGYIISFSGGGSIGNETNFFGAKTKKALKMFQKDNNSIPDGIVGPKTRALINK